MRKIIIGLALFIFLSFGLFASYVVGFNDGLKNSSTLEPYNLDKLEKVRLNSDKLWSLIQEWRKSEGLQPYIKDQRLCEMAQKRAPEVKKEFVPHEGFNKYLNEYPGIEFAENNTGALSEQDALDRWLNSPSHADTLRHDYKYSCIATKDYKAVQIFSNF